jgi:hypothetical protein
MPVEISHVQDARRLELRFRGDVDIALAQVICDICIQLRPYLKVCVMDLTGAERLLDSGVALLQLLHCHLSDLGVAVEIIADDPEMRDRVAAIKRPPRYPVPLRHRGGTHAEVVGPHQSGFSVRRF